MYEIIRNIFHKSTYPIFYKTKDFLAKTDILDRNQSTSIFEKFHLIIDVFYYLNKFIGTNNLRVWTYIFLVIPYRDFTYFFAHHFLEKATGPR